MLFVLPHSRHTHCALKRSTGARHIFNIFWLKHVFSVLCVVKYVNLVDGLTYARLTTSNLPVTILSRNYYAENISQMFTLLLWNKYHKHITHDITNLPCKNRSHRLMADRWLGPTSHFSPPPAICPHVPSYRDLPMKYCNFAKPDNGWCVRYNLLFQTNSTFREPAHKALLRVILHRTYSHAVFDPEKLNSYQPFSPEV